MRLRCSWPSRHKDTLHANSALRCAPPGLACIWYGLYRYGGQKIQNEDWAFERGTDEGNKMSYYVISYYNSFLLLVRVCSAGGLCSSAFHHAWQAP